MYVMLFFLKHDFRLRASASSFKQRPVHYIYIYIYVCVCVCVCVSLYRIYVSSFPVRLQPGGYFSVKREREKEMLSLSLL